MLATPPQSQSVAHQDPNATQVESAASPYDRVLSQNSSQVSSGMAQTFPPSYHQTEEQPSATALHAKFGLSTHNDRNVMLPPLSTVTRGHGLRGGNYNIPHQPVSASTWPVLSPVALPATAKMDSPSTMDLDTGSNSVTSAASPDRYGDGRAPSVNLDDPDVRLAAEALGDLRADFVSSPPSRTATLPISPPAAVLQSSRTQSPQQEPLFSLLTTSHPFIATTIGGASSAYGGAKNYSPRFKSGAEYVENYLTPLANTVGSVGRVTGVEGSVRWFLGAGRRNTSSSSDVEAPGNSKKRRKVDKESEMGSNKRLDQETEKQLASSQRDLLDQEMFPSTPKGDRRLSMASTVDTLPAYDEMRSPAYTETAESQRGSTSNGNSGAAWQSRLVMSTSGLGVAMSDESLRSLKYCLRWLRWANDHMGGVVGNLKTTLDQYDSQRESEAAQLEETVRQEEAIPAEEATMTPEQSEQSRTELAARINVLKGDVLKTLQDVINTVSKYAGGALPENARILVRRHLTSLPQRFRVATMVENNGQGDQPDSESAMRDGALKILVLAKEGLDMVAQVSGVLDGTIVSAEEWCERMGKRKPKTEEASQQQGDPPLLPQTEQEVDVKMG